VCIGVEPDYYDADLVDGILSICRGLGLTTAIDYPYKGALVPNAYYGKPNPGITSIMLEINKRVLE
jgi:N-formylglutamate amidohydrolase